LANPPSLANNAIRYYESAMSTQDETNRIQSIKDLTREALADRMESMGERRFRADQLFKWIYKRDVSEFSEMTDISSAFREQLATAFRLPRFGPPVKSISKDGTVKLGHRLDDGQIVESVLIPDQDRLTLCVSSQVGCKLGCRFCRTGQYGFVRDLSAGEIVEQILAAGRTLGERQSVTNIVLMGMGEPLLNLDNIAAALAIAYDEHGLNFSPRKITLSTAGIPEAMDVLGRRVHVSLAVSLHAADDSVRSMLMPANKKWPLKDVLAACRRFPIKKRERITFEVILIKDVNDSIEMAEKLVKALKGIPSKINLIPFNPFAGVEFQPPDEETVQAFADYLRQKNLVAVIRKEKGADILAACGQLAGKADS